MKTSAYYLFGIIAVCALITVFEVLNLMGIHPYR